MSTLLIRGGRVIDPAAGVDRTADVLIRDGLVVGFDVPANDHGPVDETIEAQGLIVAPGLIDLHTHLGEPGFEDDETIATGTAAALAGGYTAVAALPGTQPPTDSTAAVEFIRLQAARANHCRVHVVACVSQGRNGEQLAEIGQLVHAGAVAFSDAPSSVFDPELMRRALQYCRMFGRPVFNHPEVHELTRDGVMHDGLVSLVLGLPGMPAAAEDVMVGRDIILAESTGSPVHITQLSSSGSVDLVRRAKKRGVPVTCGVTPQHLTLTDERLRTFNSFYKTNPPLRDHRDQEALIQGLADGTIDCIVSGHQPHSAEKTLQELDRAPFGVVALETAVALVVSHLIEPGHLSWNEAIDRLSTQPARILGVAGGTLQAGTPADITVIDPTSTWTVDPKRFGSLSRNTPYAGWQLQGKITHTIVGGEIRYRRHPLPAGEASNTRL